jgi:hypothetical protein
LLQIGSGRLLVGLSKWLVKFLDTDKEELVIPGRGKIKANAASVNRILGLPMGEYEVEYEFNGSAINFINEKCRFEDGRAPTIKSITERIAASKEANDDYLRCWLMVAISTFLCGSTALSISPKCYPSLVDLSKVKELNWCQFVVDTFKVSVGKMGKQDSFLGCHYFLAVSPFLFFVICLFHVLHLFTCFFRAYVQQRYMAFRYCTRSLLVVIFACAATLYFFRWMHFFAITMYVCMYENIKILQMF